VQIRDTNAILSAETGCETWSLTMWVEEMLKVLDNSDIIALGVIK